jgi:hypothetical protein
MNNYNLIISNDLTNEGAGLYVTSAIVGTVKNTEVNCNRSRLRLF